MKLARTHRFQPGMLYFAPALDTVLTLVFFLLLGTSYLLQPGIGVTVPRSPFVLAPQRNPQVVGITGAPRPGVFFDNEELSLAELRSRLSAEPGRSRTVVIKADQSANYEIVVEVMNIALELGLPVVLATDETN